MSRYIAIPVPVHVYHGIAICIRCKFDCCSSNLFYNIYCNIIYSTGVPVHVNTCSTRVAGSVQNGAGCIIVPVIGYRWPTDTEVQTQAASTGVGPTKLS